MRRPGGRSARIRQKVIDACVEIVAEAGGRGLTAERVARRAGVHRSTIHRRWASVDELLADAVTQVLATSIPRPIAIEAQSDLTSLAKELQASLMDAKVSALLRALPDRIPYCETLAICSASLWRQLCDMWVGVLNDAIARGSLPAKLESREVAAAILAPIYLRTLLSLDAEDAIDVELVVRQALAGGTAIAET